VRLVDDPALRRNLGTKARERVSAERDWQDLVRRYDPLIKVAFRGPPRRHESVAHARLRGRPMFLRMWRRLAFGAAPSPAVRPSPAAQSLLASQGHSTDAVHACGTAGWPNSYPCVPTTEYLRRTVPVAWPRPCRSARWMTCVVPSSSVTPCDGRGLAEVIPRGPHPIVLHTSGNRLAQRYCDRSTDLSLQFRSCATGSASQSVRRAMRAGNHRAECADHCRSGADWSENNTLFSSITCRSEPALLLRRNRRIQPAEITGASTCCRRPVLSQAGLPPVRPAW
jgi:hypothetical protein